MERSRDDAMQAQGEKMAVPREYEGSLGTAMDATG